MCLPGVPHRIWEKSQSKYFPISHKMIGYDTSTPVAWLDRRALPFWLAYQIESSVLPYQTPCLHQGNKQTQGFHVWCSIEQLL